MKNELQTLNFGVNQLRQQKKKKNVVTVFGSLKIYVKQASVLNPL